MVCLDLSAMFDVHQDCLKGEAPNAGSLNLKIHLKMSILYQLQRKALQMSEKCGAYPTKGAGTFACSRKPNTELYPQLAALGSARPLLGRGRCPARLCNIRVSQQLASHDSFMLLFDRCCMQPNCDQSVGLVCAPVTLPPVSAPDSEADTNI